MIRKFVKLAFSVSHTPRYTQLKVKFNGKQKTVQLNCPIWLTRNENSTKVNYRA